MKRNHQPRKRSRYGRIWLAVILLPAGWSTLTGAICNGDNGDTPVVEGLGPPSRWIGWYSMDTSTLDPLVDPCPVPNVPDPEDTWRFGRLFSPLEVLRKLGGVDQNDNLIGMGSEWLVALTDLGAPDALLNPTFEEGVFCFYEWIGDPVNNTQSQQIKRQITLADLDLDPDLPALVPLDMTPEELSADIASTLHGTMLKQYGATDFEYSPTSSPTPVVVAVLDSAVTDWGVPGLPGTGQLDHGRHMGLLIRSLACPGNGNSGDDCHVSLANYLVLDREPDGQGGSKINRTQGGFFGTPGVLAEMLWWATAIWKLKTPDAKLVINMSVGWEYHPDLSPSSSRAAQAVRTALTHARCAAALPIAAAGNDSGGQTSSSGPMYPANFEDDDWAGCDPEVAGIGESMVYSVGGVDGLGRKLASTRIEGRPRFAAYAYHVPADDQYLTPGPTTNPVYTLPPLTGTSLAAAATSATAAVLYTHGYDGTARDVMELIYLGGSKVEGAADYCRDPNCTPTDTEIHRLSFCDALREGGVLRSCPDVAPGNPFWSAEQVTEAKAIAQTVTLPTLQDQPVVQECGPETRFYFAQGQMPAAPCPDAQQDNFVISPQLDPQPRVPICPACGVDKDGSLYSISEPAISPSPLNLTPGTMQSLRLKLTGTNGVLYYDITGALQSGEVVWMEGLSIPPSFTILTAEVTAVISFYGGQTRAETQQIAILP